MTRAGARKSGQRGVVSRWWGIVLAAVVGLAATGCGISRDGRPFVVGSGLPAAAGNATAVERPAPTGATNAEELVDRYLHAAVGGGDDAIDNVKRFMTPRLQSTWRTTSQQLTIIRVLLEKREVSTGDTTPLTVTYQPVGVLTEQGIVEDLLDQPSVTATFNVVPLAPTSSQLRLDTAPHLLLISDDAFSDKAATPYYRAQSIYFWDRTNRWLVPDVRYLPLTLKVDQRPDQLVQWLLIGPSPWLRPAVSWLPARTVVKTPVVNRDGTLVVNLSVQAVGDRPDSLQRLVYQLQWSLRSTAAPPSIELQIEGQRQNVSDSSSTSDYLKYNAAALLPRAQRFHLRDHAVVSDSLTGEAPSLLSSNANKGVVAAAITANLALAAFVHQANDGTMSVRIVGKVDAKPVDRVVWLPGGFTAARPVWVPGTKDQLLVVSGSRLYAVNSGGSRTDITPDSMSTVQMVAVAPDGRRIAMIADNHAYVAALGYDGTIVHIGDQRRSIVPRQLTSPAAIAWESQDRVLVVGSAQGGGALWRVTADGVVAENLSDALRGVLPNDIVAHPTEPGSPSRGEITIQTDHGTGRLFGREFSVEGRPASPFYAG